MEIFEWSRSKNYSKINQKFPRQIFFPQKEMEGTSLQTPYYQTRVKSHPGKCTRFPETNYRPYLLFSLRTRLEPVACRRLKVPVLVHFHLRYLDERMKVVVEFWKSGRPIKLSVHHRQFLQKAIDHIIGDEPGISLLMSDGSQWLVDGPWLNLNRESLIPSWWTKEVARFLSTSPHLRPHHREKNEYQIAGIYIDLSWLDAHQHFFNSIYNESMDQLNEMYLRGYIVLPETFSPELLENWEVQSVEKITVTGTTSTEISTDSIRKKLFFPNWEDFRLTDPVGGMVPFLVKHLVNGSNTLLLEVESDLFSRHQVAIIFRKLIPVDKYQFQGNFIQVLVNNLKEAQQAASLISLAKNIPAEQVILFQFPSRMDLNLYLTVLGNMSEKDQRKTGLSFLFMDDGERQFQGYRLTDPRREYCLSVEIPFEANPNYYQGIIRNYVRQETTNTDQLRVTPWKKRERGERLTEIDFSENLAKVPKSLLSNVSSSQIDADKADIFSPISPKVERIYSPIDPTEADRVLSKVETSPSSRQPLINGIETRKETVKIPEKIKVGEKLVKFPSPQLGVSTYLPSKLPFKEKFEKLPKSTLPGSIGAKLSMIGETRRAPNNGMSSYLPLKNQPNIDLGKMRPIIITSPTRPI